MKLSLGNIVCRIIGHKDIITAKDYSLASDYGLSSLTHRSHACKRCGATWKTTIQSFSQYAS